MPLSQQFLKHFEPLEDKRCPIRNFRHNLHDILTLAILGTICSADTWPEVEGFALAKEDWLRTFLELPNGIPSHDTFERVFAMLEPTVFERCFADWVATLRLQPEQREVIAVDGKTMRGSHNLHKGQKPLHMVSAWAVENGLVLAQVKTEEKSNEIEAIPRLLGMLDIKGCIVTTDAMGCQKDIAATIKNQGGDYVLTLKDNQPKLSELVQAVFEVGDKTTYEGMHYLKQIEKVRGAKNRGEHGRVETRKYTLVTTKDAHTFGLQWPGLVSLGRLEVVRTVRSKDVERSTRYFLTSLSYRDMRDFMRAVRRHWEVEINLHWSLDVSFGEDKNRVRDRNGAENMAIVRRIALNMLKHSEGKIGIAAKRKKAGWDHAFLSSLFA